MSLSEDEVAQVIELIEGVIEAKLKEPEVSAKDILTEGLEVLDLDGTNRTRYQWSDESGRIFMTKAARAIAERRRPG